MKLRLQLLRYVASEGTRYVWHACKNAVKRLLGREPRREERFVFFRQYILHVTRIRRIRGITSSAYAGYGGAGHQALLIMNAQNFARTTGLAYLHTPFTVINHADRPMPEWVQAWEEFFNLGAGETLCDPRRSDVVNFSFVQPQIDLCLGKGCTDGRLARSFTAMIPEFRAKYKAHKPPRTASGITVAVHVRRGDVSAQASSQLFTRTDVVSQTIKDVKSILDSAGQACSIHVHSQGQPADFEELRALGVDIFLDRDALWTMRQLIEADVLVMAKGAFSCYAGIISRGIKLFDPAAINSQVVGYLPSYDWKILSQADDWIPCAADGSFDRAAFELRLSLLLEAKANAKAAAQSST